MATVGERSPFFLRAGAVKWQFLRFLAVARLCRNFRNHLDVMLSEGEASAFPGACKKADSSAAPQNDILTQSGRRGGALLAVADRLL